MKSLQELLSKPIAVLGAGVSGRAIIAFLERKGAEYDIYDERETITSGSKALASLVTPEKYGVAIVSPGWRKDHPMVESLRSAGVQLISDIDLAWLYKNEVAPDQRWIALTGTNGKTTTIQMMAAILQASHLTGVACGNVGDPVISVLMANPELNILALELSSFQIEWSLLPEYAAVAVLNIAEDHIDWHGSFDSYANSKMQLLASSDRAILNAMDSEVVARSTSFKGEKIFYSLETPAPGELGLVEDLLIDRAFGIDPQEAHVLAELADITPQVPHNVSNALAAAGLARSIGISHEEIKLGLSSFLLDHHRLELVLELNGISWINDSKATNPHAAIAGILSHTSVIWIAGGLAKGAKMDQLVKRAAPRLKAALLIGSDRELIAAALAEYAPSVPVIHIDGDGTPEDLMNEIVSKAKSLATSGDTVLLAPACASMDQFTSYAHRGDLFAKTVRDQIKAGSAHE